MTRSILLVLLLICAPVLRGASPPDSASAAVLHGRVQSTDSLALAGADVYLPTLQVGAASDGEGHFRINRLPPGRQLVVVDYLGYRSWRRTVDLAAGDTLRLTIVLSPSAVDVRPVVVTGSPVPVDPMESPQDLQVVYGRDKLTARSSSLGEAVADVPGVESVTAGSVAGKPVIRGHTGERIRVMSNGIAQEYQQYGERHAPTLDPFQYERIEVIRGPASLLYGSDALGGAVNLISPPFQFAASGQRRLEGLVTSQYFGNNGEWMAGARLEGGGESWSSHAGFAHRQAGNFHTPGEPTFAESGQRGDPRFTGEIPHTDYEQWSGCAALAGRTPLGMVSLHYDGFRNANNFLLPTGGPIGLRLDNHNLSARGRMTVGGWTLTPAAVWQRNVRLATPAGEGRAALPDAAAVDLLLDVWTARLEGQHPAGSRFNGRAGVEARRYDHDNRGEVALQPDGAYTNLAAFVFEEIRFGNWIVDAGARADVRSQTFRSSDGNPLLPRDDSRDYRNLAASLGVAWRMTPSLTATVNAGRGFRAPSFFNLYVYGLHGGVFAFQIGNPDLEPESAVDLTAALRFRSDRIEGSVAGFWNHIDRYIYLYSAPDHPLAPPADQAPFVFAHAQDDARIAGVTAQATVRPLPWLSATGALSALDSEFRAGPHRGRELPLMPALKLDGTVTVHLPSRGLVWEPQVRLGVRHSGARDAAGIYEPFGQFDDGIGPDIPFGVASTEAYTLWSTGLRGELRFGTWPVLVDLSVTNLLDSAFRDFLDTYKGYALGAGRSVNLSATIPLML